MTTEESRDRITEFLDSGVWQVAADRTKTRRAIVEALSALPDALLASIFADHLQVLVTAPAQRRVCTVVPYKCTVLALQAVQFSVVVFDSRIEAYDFPIVLSIVKDAFRHAFGIVAGIELPPSSFQDEQPNTDAGPRDAEAGLECGRPN